MTQRRTMAVLATLATLTTGAGTVAISQSAGGGPADKPAACAESAQHRTELSAAVDRYTRKVASGKDTGNELQKLEKRLEQAARKTNDDDVRLGLQDLLDETAAARAALSTDADSTAELVPVLVDRLAAFQRVC